MVAKVAVAAAVYAMDKPFSYRVPPALTVKPGMRVMVPFGRGNRRTEAIVLQVEEQEVDSLKAIDRVLDAEPVLDENGLRTAAFVRERSFCTFYDVIKAMLPAGLWFRAVERIALVPDTDWRQIVKRQPAAVQVLEILEELGGEAEYPALRERFPEEETLQAAIRYLDSKKLIRHEAELHRKVGDKTERMASLAIPAEEAAEYAARKRRTAPIQAAVLDLLSVLGSGSTKEVGYYTGATSATFRTLEKQGILELSEVPTFRRVEVRPVRAEPLVLNGEQQEAYDAICRQWERDVPGAALLYGVTGSGKTSVYLKLIYRCLESGRTALLLVPEIALTPQLVSLFAAHFSDRVAVLHSGLRVGERYDEWKRIRSGAARVVVGTRSAVFAPLQNLGLLIVDEEQEHTYKSENSPRYHARDVALFRGHREKALVLLGSATPSVETMYHAQKGDYGLYRLCTRYNGCQLPPVDIVDMKQELKNGNPTSISAPLEDAIHDAIRDGRQTILFLNRRGASRFVACVNCGEVPQCPRCSVHLTYHAANRRLMCHHCGHSEPMPERCPLCGGPLKPVGTGTQKVEEELHSLLPDVGILRMDTDTITAVNTHEKLLYRFESEKIPILLGTQMVAKGLDFENVALVGVLDADMSLYVENYRAAETTFSMITQVVGRAGRGSVSGRAIIQTMTPENAVITLAARQDYDRFYEMEIGLRKLRNCPPFRDLLVVTFSGPFEERVAESARRFRSVLVNTVQSEAWREIPITILGPAPAAVAKVNNRYRYRLTLGCVNTRPVRQMLSQMIRAFAADRTNRGVTVFVDVNPYD